MLLTLHCSYWLIVALNIFLWGCGIYFYRQELQLNGRRTIQALRLMADKTWQVQLGRKFYPAQLARDSVVTPWVSVLNFKLLPLPGQQTVRCVIFPDSFVKDDYRRLRVWLRLSAN